MTGNPLAGNSDEDKAAANIYLVLQRERLDLAPESRKLLEDAYRLLSSDPDKINEVK